MKLKTSELTNYEIDILDHYVVRNNIPTMNFLVFRSMIDNTLPTWRSEQLCSDTANGQVVYNQYISFKK